MRHAIVLGLVLLLASCAFGQTQPNTLTLQLNGVDITQALTAISEKAQVTILGDTTVKGTVNCNLSNITLEQALDTICKMNKLVWMKAYTSANPNDKANATKLFNLFDALKELGGSSLICVDPATQSQTIYVPGATNESVDTDSVASGLKLKPVYLIRAEPDPAAIAAAKEKEKQAQQAGLNGNPPADSKVAAQQVWGYFTRMPMDQQFQAMHELRNMMFNNLTPEQRHQLFQNSGDRGGNHGDHGGQGGPPGVPPQQ